MSDWIGPNVYRIQSYKDRKAEVTLSGSNVITKSVSHASDIEMKETLNTNIPGQERQKWK